MSKMIFVNLPVSDLAKAEAFYGALGFSRNPAFSDDAGSCMVWSDAIYVMILTHAKWQLLHTLKPVKEVAREVGFPDELYFSRLFKKATGRSPTAFREFETAIRGGSNLSMPSSHAPILRAAPAADT